MNDVNIISYLLLAFFVAGTSYVTISVAKEVRDDFRMYVKPIKRLLRRYLSHFMHEFTSFFRSFSMRMVS